MTSELYYGIWNSLYDGETYAREKVEEYLDHLEDGEDNEHWVKRLTEWRAREKRYARLLESFENEVEKP